MLLDQKQTSVKLFWEMRVFYKIRYEQKPIFIDFSCLSSISVPTIGVPIDK